MKAQADIISAVIIIIIAITLVAAAYIWGMPLIEKRQHTVLAERVNKYFTDRTKADSLVKKIEDVARNGGEDTFTADVKGLWFLYPCPDADGGGCTCDSASIPNCASENNSIHFTFFSKVALMSPNEGWLPLNSPDTSPIGVIGEYASAIFARADTIADGYNITYKTWFRELDESSEKGHKIVLVASPSTRTTSSERTLKIARGDTRAFSQDGKILIITEIKISLI